MAEITITAPDAWVAAISPDIVAAAVDSQNLPFCQRVLTAWGKTFAETTTAEKVQLFCLLAMWKERAMRRTEVASSAAGTQATIDALNEF